VGLTYISFIDTNSHAHFYPEHILIKNAAFSFAFGPEDLHTHGTLVVWPNDGAMFSRAKQTFFFHTHNSCCQSLDAIIVIILMSHNVMGG
jgi:hypothetical protein